MIDLTSPKFKYLMDYAKARDCEVHLVPNFIKVITHFEFRGDPHRMHSRIDIEDFNADPDDFKKMVDTVVSNREGYIKMQDVLNMEK